MYEYNAKVVSIYDGDTMRVDVDLGCGITILNKSVRLFGINTPEVRGEEREQGLIVRDWLRTTMPEGTVFILKTHKDMTGKYGRLLGTIIHDGIDINQHMLEAGMAVKYGE